MLSVIVGLVRRKQLANLYAVLWLATGYLILPVAVWLGLLNEAGRRLGVADPPNLWLFFVLVFLSLVCTWRSPDLRRERGRWPSGLPC